MTLEELIAQCQTAIHSPLSTGDLILTITRKSRVGKRIRLARKYGGPYGTVLDDAEPGRVHAMFKAQEILDWIERQADV